MANSKEPLFILMHTLTNHPPYAAPTLPWQDSELVISQQMRKINGGLPEEALRTYHYTSEVLGDFLDYVKQGELSGKTIVALTGDHGVRGALSTSATDLFTKAVPFYLYVPDDYKPEIEPDLQTLGSHRDIMPTLYNLSLSEANYPNLGNNLYTLRDETNEFAVLHHNVVTNEGLVLAIGNEEGTEVKSFRKKNSFLYGPQKQLKADTAVKHAKAYFNVIDWLKRYQLQDKQLAKSEDSSH